MQCLQRCRHATRPHYARDGGESPRRTRNGIHLCGSVLHRETCKESLIHAQGAICLCVALCTSTPHLRQEHGAHAEAHARMSRCRSGQAAVHCSRSCPSGRRIGGCLGPLNLLSTAARPRQCEAALDNQLLLLPLLVRALFPIQGRSGLFQPRHGAGTAGCTIRGHRHLSLAERREEVGHNVCSATPGLAPAQDTPPGSLNLHRAAHLTP
mmetsp:Transcript_15184/g.33710  ORF Transcript_15184/g.33710 Transcript_15184/m.33710 type:complete len:210 (+) Transcript_15184:1394-2023(+)